MGVVVVVVVESPPVLGSNPLQCGAPLRVAVCSDALFCPLLVVRGGVLLEMPRLVAERCYHVKLQRSATVPVLLGYG